MLFFSCTLVLLFTVCVHCDTGITGFSAEPDFRNLELSWSADNEIRPTDFIIKYCENQIWGEHHCRRIVVKGQPSGSAYNKKIKKLKMDTEYNIYLSVFNKESRKGEGKAAFLNAKTKGFSAKARDCSPLHTEVVVETGPGFTGLVSAEGALNPSCSVQGQGGDEETHTLMLNHKDCRSGLNSSVAWTYVVVQENLPILTHSTKRFLVMCKFGLPDVFTVQSGLNLPSTTNIRPPSGSIKPVRGARNLPGPGRAKDNNSDDIITLEDYQDIELSREKDAWTFRQSIKHKQRPEVGEKNQVSRVLTNQQVAGEADYMSTNRQTWGQADANKFRGQSSDAISEMSMILVLAVVGVVVLVSVVALLAFSRTTSKSLVEEEEEYLKENRKSSGKRESIV